MDQSNAPGVVPFRIRELLVFGDSLSDSGNARALLGDGAFPCPPHWANRRCDGPLWVDHLAAQLDLPPLVPSTAGGGNHAHGGARSGRGTTPKGLPNLLTQVEGLAGDGKADGGDQKPQGSGTLVVLRAGANDYLDAPASAAVADAVNHHLLIALQTLADRGLRQFLVPSELPWGSSPIERPGMGALQRQALNGLIAQQNDDLRGALAALARRRDLVVVQPDAHGLFLAIQADPAAWGFQEIGRPALGAEGLDKSSFLWWDAWGHFTSAFHRLLAGCAVRELEQAGLISPATHNERSCVG
ncbi:MAG: SGNH/GDSL hydrolase family protein [Cyanobacteriota bacterium]|nr:SGNH/GDSL hydrolase family protein [Cyanobacteriota bacterium]